MQKKFIIIFSVIFLLALTGYAVNQREKLSDMLDMPIFDNSQEVKDETTDVVVEKEDEKKSDLKNIPVKQVEETNTPETTFSYFGELFDVSGGIGSGIAQASFKNNRYQVVARFKDLPEPNGTDFYEGWVVRKGANFSVISTGKVVKENGIYVDRFSSDKDLTDHDFYVLTLEPDDGDPAPAAHIVEGTMKLK